MALATGPGRTGGQPGFSPAPRCALTRDLLLSPTQLLEAGINPLGQLSSPLSSSQLSESGSLPDVRLFVVCSSSQTRA